MDIAKLEQTYNSLPGGPGLLAWFGKVPTFHDAEIVSLALNRRAPSELKIYGWVVDGSIDAAGYLVMQQKAVVTFTLDQITYLKLDDFSHQNVIGGLEIVHCAQDSESASCDVDVTGDDFELRLQPCFGMDSHIRCRTISISFAPGEPEDANRYPR